MALKPPFKPLSSEAAAVANALARRIGRARGLGASAIAAQVGISERRLRQVVSELREDGMAICGHPSTGYYIAKTADELEETCAFLRARAMHSLVLESRLRKIPLPDLIGQLKVPT